MIWRCSSPLQVCHQWGTPDRNTPPWPGSESGPRKGQIVRYIHSHTELSGPIYQGSLGVSKSKSCAVGSQLWSSPLSVAHGNGKQNTPSNRVTLCMTLLAKSLSDASQRTKIEPLCLVSFTASRVVFLGLYSGTWRHILTGLRLVEAVEARN